MKSLRSWGYNIFRVKQYVTAMDKRSTTQPVKLKAESKPELLSHIVTCIAPPAGRDKTMHLEPHRYRGKKNVASKDYVYSQS